MAHSHRIGGAAMMLVVLVASRARADGIIVQPRVSGGTQDYELSFADVITPNGNSFHFRDGFTISDSLPFAGAGLTVSAGRLFADLSGQWSKTGHDQGEIFQGTTFDSVGDTTPALGFEHHFDARFARHEINAAVGWAFSPQFSAYVGYKNAKLDMTQMRRPDSAPPPDNFDVLQTGDYAMDFSYHGFFLGATYSLPVRTWGALSVQSSLARLDASFQQSFQGTVYVVTPLGPFFLDPSFINSSVSGTSTGLNVGISWTGTLGWLSDRLRPLSYTIGYDQSQYKFSTRKASDGDFEEKNRRARLELRYRFAL
jgi:hypothetical protein